MSYKYKEEPGKNVVSEPLAEYITNAHLAKPFLALLGVAFTHTSASELDVIKFTRQGFKKKAILTLAKKISLTLQELAAIMHISERTLQRYDDDEVIKPEYAEKAVELARLYTRGEEVFGSLERFKLWMKTPVLVFRGETPVSLLDTSVGFSVLFNELGRIEHGIFA
jgi:putative toxin-antitoxin system antitoxin component (TIGR02293 family)